MEKNRLKIIIMTGPPYSGKGIQSKVISFLTGFKHISTGDIIRNEKQQGTDFGYQMKNYEEAGLLVPDKYIRVLLIKLIKSNRNEKGIILDGFPRTIKQAKFLKDIAERNNLEISYVFNMNVEHEELIKRASERSFESNRIDDQNIEVHLTRIQIFEKFTKPAIQFLETQFNFININGMTSIENASAIIRSYF